VNPKVYVEYIAKTDQLAKGSQEIGKSSSKAGAMAKKAFAPAVAALGAVALFSAKAVQQASNLNEAMSATQVTFGKSAKGVVDWSKTTADAFGISQRAALDSANGFGNMLRTAGLTEKQMAKMSTTLVGLGGDMASFFNQDVTEMLDKLRSGLAGEAEPLRKFGVNLSADAVAAEALALGLTKPVKDAGKITMAHQKVNLATSAYAKAIKEHGRSSDQAIRAGITLKNTESALTMALKGKTPKLTEAQKVQARYAILMDQTSKAQGDAERTGDQLAGQQRRLAAETEQASAAFGAALLPIVSKVMAKLLTFTEFLQKNPALMRAFVIGVTALASAIVLLNIAMTVFAVVTSGALLPILAVIAAIAALIFIAVLMWKNWDKITAAITNAWEGIKNAANTARDTIKAAFTAMTSAVSGTVRGFVAWLRTTWASIVTILAAPVTAAFALLARIWNMIVTGARSAVDSVKSAWNGLKSFIGGIVGAIGSSIGKVKSAFDAVGSAAHDAYSAVRNAISGIINYLGDKVGSVRAKATQIANAIKAPINSFIASWNSTSIQIPRIPIPKVTIPGTSKSIGGGSVGGGSVQFPRIPTLAKGGVLTAPTLFVGGEAGREIVAPEDLLREIVADHGGSYVLNLHVRTADAADIAYGFRRLELLRTGR